MAYTESIVAAMESTTLKKEQLQKAFEELDSHKSVMQNSMIQWKELDEHFSYIDESLKKRLKELHEKEKEFNAKASVTRKVLEKRDEDVVAKEQSSLFRVQKQKDAAVSIIHEASSKKQKETPLDSSAKSDGDAAVSIIHEACSKKQKEAPVDSSAKSDGDAENKVNDSPVMDVESSVPTFDKEEKSHVKSDAPKSAAAFEVKPRPQLKQFCEQMDSKGLLNLLSVNRKYVSALRDEVPAALRFAIDPARLVLDAVEGFYPPNQGNKMETGLPAQRRSCILLLESLAPLLADPVMRSDHPEVESNVKEQAKMIADNWKSKLADVDTDASNGNSLEAQAFLQLLVTFGIASEYDEDELCKLVISVSRRRQTPELCQSLGLAEKMPGVMETLVNSGKQIEAVNFAYTFGLVDIYPPVPLLKAYLKEARKAAQVKSGNTSVAAQNEANARELFALKAVVNCIEDHDLELEYPLETLRKRVLQLEKAKTDKKRSADAIRGQHKKPRANMAGGYLPTASGIERAGVYATASANTADMSLYRSADRIQYPSSAVGASAYNLPGHNSYDRSSQGIYGPSSLPRSYMYSGDNLGSSGLGSGSYNVASNYNSYHHGSGLTSALSSSTHPSSAYPSSAYPSSAYPSTNYPSTNYPSSYLQ
ncbi:hypothetical protein KI387_023699 [Taxus chinensis]|uniref:FRIGIDA-like protein n=1 Tax=Taxus chinensis TaxID=29808 RepID=A0AA38G2Q2_TAXCH|nr:hypothetical protein KI387_023699 [Taxus chinensis]